MIVIRILAARGRFDKEKQASVKTMFQYALFLN